jgi:hypothetical protein
MTVRAKLNRLGLQLVGDISWPEHAAIFSTPFKASMDLNIPLIMYGENPQLEYGGPMGSEQSRQMTERWRSEFGGFLGLRTSDFVGMDAITERDMSDYEPPKPLTGISSYFSIEDVEAHFLGQYLPWDSHKNAELSLDHGMIQEKPSDANWWDHENCDNAQTGIHDYFMFLKYGYGRGCSQISVDIRNGLVGRKEALMWVEEHDGVLSDYYMGVHKWDILMSIGITPHEYLKIEKQWDQHNVLG